MTAPKHRLESASLQSRVSVIIPVLNEEARIIRQLERVTSLAGVHEVIVVDGGSSDRTPDLSQSVTGVRLVSAARGRASQMNAGARCAGGDVLLFLHADVLLPDNASAWIDRALSDEATIAGAFRTWTVADSSPSWLAPLLHLADVRSRYTRLPYGDQAIFVRAAIFHDVGGFPDLPLMEDLELCRRLTKRGRIQIVPASVHVSGRRFIERPIFYTFLVNAFPLLYRCGVPAASLAKLYNDVR